VPPRRHDALEASRRAAAPLLRELREAGYPAYDLTEFAQHKLRSKKAATILVRWLARIDQPYARSDIAKALTDVKARPVATQPLLDLFRELPNDAWEKDRVAAALGTLARDDHFEQVAELVRNPDHGDYRQYLFWAIGYMKDPRAVDLCLDLLDDDDLGMAAPKPRVRRGEGPREARQGRRRWPGRTLIQRSHPRGGSAMKAVTLDAPDSPPAVRDDLPAPAPAADELLVRVRASSANPVDNAIAAGMLSGMVEHEFPVVLGRDYVGVVE
jgi:HEAT repeat protein